MSTAPRSSDHRLFVGLRPPDEIARRLHAQAVSALDARDWRHLAYHLAGDLVRIVIRGGRVAFARA